jgi:RNA polymerase subunit RPABC4/transcription elongation factor Spt4
MRITSLMLGLLLFAVGCQSSSHQEAEKAATVVYCNQCGVVAGKITTCPNFSSHDFQSASSSAKVFCNQCGAVPGDKPTVCPNFSSHDFQVFAN